MYCKKCGKEIAEGLSTCPECSAATAAAQAPASAGEMKPKNFIEGYKNFGALSTGSKILHIAIPVIALVIVVAVLSSIFSTDYIAFVKDGKLESFSDEETVGEAFEDFFDKPEWKTFESDKGKRIVEFTGECEYAGETAEVCIQFEIDEDDETFEIDYADVDGESMNDFEIVGMLEAVYEE